MKTVAYMSAFVPAPWITAHGLRPLRVVPQCSATSAEGVCPLAAALAETVSRAGFCDAVIIATTCDQMRRIAEHIAGPSVFLLNVPATWQTPASRQLYIDELRRLGKFLLALGGHDPQLHLPLEPRVTSPQQPDGRNKRLALVGPHLRQCDRWIFQLIDELGACVALDATETGLRGQPAPLDPQRFAADPLDELARAYFDTIPDAFRRPDSILHDWLVRQVSASSARGVLLLRCAWCDQWHGQLARIRQTTGLPVVEIDLAEGPGNRQILRTRIETLVSILR